MKKEGRKGKRRIKGGVGKSIEYKFVPLSLNLGGLCFTTEIQIISSNRITLSEFVLFLWKTLSKHPRIISAEF